MGEADGKTMTGAEMAKIVGGVMTLGVIALAVLSYYFGPSSSEQDSGTRPECTLSCSYGSYEDSFGMIHEYYPDEGCYAEADSAEDQKATRPFADCDEARSYGADPVYEGDPGYGPHLDRDGDGVGCEPWSGY